MEEGDENEKMKFENELKKLKLSAENGAKFMGGAALPPEIESQWLDNIMAFEKASQDGKMIKIYDFLERPPLIPLQEVPAHQIEEALDELSELMASKGLSLDTTCEVDARELYRFIVEELMDEEIQDMQVEGMVTHLTYEEYHPNHPYDIKRYTEDFISTLFKRDTEYYDMGLSNEVISYDGSLLEKKEPKKLLLNFINSFQKFTLKNLDLEEPEILESVATQKAHIEYHAVLLDSAESVAYAGEAKFNFINEYGYWYINGVNMPGLKL